MRNIRLDISYDGTRYQGWQRQAGNPNTIQGKIETALSRILGESIEISGSGRTDSGVHARAQVANFHCESDMSTDQILAELRRYLPEDIGINSCKEASVRFHARLNAREKTYEYRIWNSDRPCVFERRYVYPVEGELDVDAMDEAARHFLGTHDFGAFCAHRKTKKSTVRCIKAVKVERVGHEVRFRVTGDGFLHNMVRIMVGTLIEVGQGKRSPDSIPGLFDLQRRDTGYLVPGRGLCLEEVVY